MWIIGFITSLVYVFVFFSAKIYADMGLNIYYTLISIYGFYHWSRSGKPKGTEKEETHKILYQHAGTKLVAGILMAILCIHLLLYYFLSHFTDSPIPIGDAFTTAIGIVATWMLAKRIIEHWIFWVIVNTVSIYLYYLRGLYPTMILYFCYAVLAIIGWYNWKKKGEKIND